MLPCTADAAFVGDVTVPDNTALTPGESFDKTWRVRNSGTCPWEAGYRLALVSGERMGAVEGQTMAVVVPDATLDITVTMVAPKNPGTYTGVWQMTNAKGEPFGHKLTVVIQVPFPETAVKTSTRTADGMVMVYVPGGEFLMGSNQGRPDERPVHTVMLNAFWVDCTEVTNAQYRRCSTAGGCSGSRYGDNADFNGDRQPVVGVAWADAAAYCQWAGARLPTEAEWEYAARGPKGRVYPWGNTFDGTRLNYCDVNCPYGWADKKVNDRYVRAAPVGSYPGGASWCGAWDIAGNVWEWVADWYADYNAGWQANPTGPAAGEGRVQRGGSWGNDPNGVRSTARVWIGPNEGYDNVGFRCAQSAP
jgi:formylglycine-generating enzyme required for sulfatase activity